MGGSICRFLSRRGLLVAFKDTSKFAEKPGFLLIRGLPRWLDLVAASTGKNLRQYAVQAVALVAGESRFGAGDES